MAAVPSTQSVVVPVEPTPKMMAATWDHEIDKSGGIESQNTRNARIWSAMLAALSPEAPAREGVDVVQHLADAMAAHLHGSPGNFEIAIHALDEHERALRAILTALTPRHEAPAEGAVELLPCPFCGGAAGIVHIEDGENEGGSCVCCTVCQASGNLEFERKENFISNWNRRARSSAPEALGNLLAVIHGDGGHRALEVGTKQAALEAEKIVAGLFAAPSADKLRIDLWWNADDWETTFDNLEDAYEAATGGYCVGVARLGRATEHDAVWAACIACDTTGDGETDDREIRLFATEDEARQALAALKAEGGK